MRIQNSEFRIQNACWLLVVAVGFVAMTLVAVVMTPVWLAAWVAEKSLESKVLSPK